jgi:predicted phosphoadenosine phosphosulfate sulfurtransferase
MVYYLPDNVFNTALDRIRYLFSEFQNIVVSISGGKDSTVVYNLCLLVAKEQNRLPLNVLFIDQEAEYFAVIEHVRSIMTDPDVNPMWVQVPFGLSNSTSHNEDFFQCWQEGQKWVREKEHYAITKNTFGVARFAGLFDSVIAQSFGKPTANIQGIRAEESPSRRAGLNEASYKHVTWGRKHVNGRDLTFSPIYDWKYTDVWKAIFDNRWAYCVLYNQFLANGQSMYSMRISSVLHEMSYHKLIDLQEYDPKLYNALLERVPTITDVKHLKQDHLQAPRVLPSMFDTWEEYRDYLAENLLQPEHKTAFAIKFQAIEKTYSTRDSKQNINLQRVFINTILSNDYSFSKLAVWQNKPANVSDNRKAKGYGYGKR